MKAVAELTIRTYHDNCALSRGLELADLLRLEEQRLVYVQPCVAERGKLMADIELTDDLDSKFFDSSALCSVLEAAAPGFSALRCSPRLGVAKFTWKGREISVFRNGKLKVQRCLDRADVERVAARVIRLVWPAVLCPVCGQAALACASGRCGRCATGETPRQASELPAGELLEHALGLEDRGRAAYFALRFIIETPEKRDAAAGIAVLDGLLTS